MFLGDLAVSGYLRAMGRTPGWRAVGSGVRGVSAGTSRVTRWGTGLARVISMTSWRRVSATKSGRMSAAVIIIDELITQRYKELFKRKGHKQMKILRK